MKEKYNLNNTRLCLTIDLLFSLSDKINIKLNQYVEAVLLLLSFIS